MNRKIFISLDGIVIDVLRTITRIYNEDHEYYKDFTPIDYHDIKTWKFEELSLEPFEYIQLYMNNPRFFDKAEMIDSAKWIIDRLYELQDFQIIFYSNGTHPNVILKKRWILNNFPYADFIYNYETPIDMRNSYCVDNNSENLYKCNAEEKICFGDVFDKNEDWDGLRIKTWSDIYEYIKSKEE